MRLFGLKITQREKESGKNLSWQHNDGSFCLIYKCSSPASLPAFGKYAFIMYYYAACLLRSCKMGPFRCIRRIGADCNNHLFQSFFLFFVRDGAVCGAKKLF